MGTIRGLFATKTFATIRGRYFNVLMASLLLSSLSYALQAAPAPPVHLTSEQDHQRMMELLNISSLRAGPSGDPKGPNAANTDESKVPPYSLPDPLVLKNSQKVTFPEMWWKQRRPEIVEDFDREIYGRVPANTPNVDWKLVSSTRETLYGVPVI